MVDIEEINENDSKEEQSNEGNGSPRAKQSVNPAMEEGYEDILGSGAVCRKLIRSRGGPKPEFGQQVTIRYNGYLKESGEEFARDVVKEFRLGQGEVIPAIELGVRVMSVGEIVLINCDERFGYGELGLPPKVPPKATLKFEIELLSMGDPVKAAADMTPNEVLQEARSKKESGNEWFGQKNYAKAVSMYKAALKILENWENESDDIGECKELLLSIGNNLSTAHSKLGNYKEAIKSAEEVLQVDENNVKAMYRMAHSHFMLDELDAAAVATQKAVKLAPGDKLVRELREKVNERKSFIKEKEKRMFAKMLSVKKPDKEKCLQGKDHSQIAQKSWLRSIIVPLVIGLLSIVVYIVYNGTNF